MAKTTETLVMDLMSPAKTITKDTEINDAIRLMKSGKYYIISVVDDNQRLIGAVSETSLIKLVKHEPTTPIGDAVWFDYIEPDAGRQTVESIMTTNITTIRPNEDIATALKVMNSASYRLLHVVDSEGKLLGIIGIKEIFERFLGV